MMTIKHILTTALIFLGFILNAQTWKPLEYNPNQPGLEKNPLKGISALFGSDNDFPHTVSGLTLTMGEVMTGMDQFRFDDIIEPFLEAEAKAGRTVILQINVDSGKKINPNEAPEPVGANQFDFNEQYLGDRYDLPDFLDGKVDKLYYLGKPSTLKDADGNDLRDELGNLLYEDQNSTGDNVFPWAGQASDNQGNPSVVIDYNDQDFIDAWLNLVQALGARYNNDNRIFIVHYGTYGIFGEWDLGFGKNYISTAYPGLTEDSWKMNQGRQQEVIDAFQAAFPNKNLIARVPEVPRPFEVGYSDGLFFGASVSDKAEEFFFFLPKLKKYNADLNWRNHPIGGEVDPAIQPILWDQPGVAVDDFNYFVTGDPELAGDGASGQNVEEVFALTHPTFLFQNEVLFSQGLPNPIECDGDLSNGESSAEICANNDPVEWAKAILASKKCGYTFHINQFKLSVTDAKPTVEVNIQNKGIAPMYADWEIELAYIDSSNIVRSLGKTNQSNNWNLSAIQPGVQENYRSYTSTVDIPDGTYYFLLKIVNPYEDRLNAAVIPVSFANTTQDSKKEGWLTLGDTVRISNKTLGTPPVIATDLSISPATATMNRGTSLQLQATVLPEDATNKTVFWETSNPFIADVDENGLVTAGSQSGTVTITALANNGNLQAQASITVESFWEIPRLIEAEDYSSIDNGEVTENLTFLPEGGTHLSNFDFGDALSYGVSVNEKETFVINVRMANPRDKGSFDIFIDGVKLQTLDLNMTSDEMDFNQNGLYGSQYSKAFELEPGLHTIQIVTLGGEYNLNYLDVQIYDPCLVNADLDEGSACDDANPNTVNDIIQTDCTCQGTPGSEIYWPVPGQVEAEHWASTTSDFPDNNITMPAFAANVEGGEGNFVGGLVFSRKLDYQIDVANDGQYTLDFRAANPQDGGEFNIYIDGVLIIEKFKLADTDGPNEPGDFGDYSTYTTQSTEPVDISAGQHTIRLEIFQGSFDLNWLAFNLLSDCTNTAGEACNDANPNTVNDIIQTDCTCQGTPGSEIYWPVPGQVEAEHWASTTSDFPDNNITMPAFGTDVEGGIGNFVGGLIFSRKLDYQIDVANDGQYTLDFRAANPQDGGEFNIYLDGNLIIEKFKLADTDGPNEPGDFGNYSIYTTQSTEPVDISAGQHTIRLEIFQGAFDLNWLAFNLLSDCTNTAGEACDDANPNTVNDIIQTDCTCQGTPGSEIYWPVPGQVEAEHWASTTSDFPDNNITLPAFGPDVEGGTGNFVGGLIFSRKLDYQIDVANDGQYILDFRAANPQDGGEFNIYLDGNLIIEKFKLADTDGPNEPGDFGDYSIYTTQSTEPVDISAGQHTIRLEIFQGSFDLNWLAFRIDDTCPDADADGICDADDVCPNLDDNLIGKPCNDGDDCTTNDVFTEDCGCAGTFADADSDGVCDANDVCPDLDDNLIGTPCNDGDDCTTNDVFTEDCGCAGTFADADNDGVCDANDVCPDLDDNLIGTPCNDGDDCTTNDVFTEDCGCAGTFADADNDGVCDANDVCADLDDNLIGTPCDDGDDCTTNDVFTEDCGCAGTPTNRELINTNFNNSIDPFTLVSGAFSTAQPTYENFIQEANRAVLEVGGVDNSNRTNMSLGLATTFDVAADKSVLIDINYELQAHWGYEDDEYTTFILEIDGQRIQYNGNYYLSKLVGGSPSTTGEQNVRLQLFGLSEGSHDLVIGLLNNKKTFKKEKSTLYLNHITVTQDCEQLACELGAPCDDGNVCTVDDVIDSDCNCTGTYIDSDLVVEDFNNSIGDFAVISGAFSYSNTRYEKVIQQSNSVILEVGGVDNSTRRNISLGLGTTFTTKGSEDVFIELDYELTADEGYENDEWTEAIIEIDGLRVQYQGENYLSKLIGGSPNTTGNQSVSLQITGLNAGNHTLVVGLLNNKKTYRLEKSTMVIDRISITQDCFPVDNTLVDKLKLEGNKLVAAPRTKPAPAENSTDANNLDFEEENLFAVFPNPAIDIININYALKEGKTGIVKVMDITGRLILTRTRTGDGDPIMEQINSSNWNEGIYLITIEANGLSKTEKLVVIK